MSTIVVLSEQSSGESRYKRDIRAVVRGLWNGAFDYFQAFDALEVAITQGIRRAWHEGAAECGVKPAEFTTEERIGVQLAISRQFNYMDGFLVAIEGGSKANGGKLTPLFSRAEMWVGAYNATRIVARTMACKDQKTEWTLGVAEHCPSCVRLSGKIKRNSYWIRKGILPRVQGADYLICRGYNCACSLVPTDKPVSKGPLPKLP